MDLNKNKINRSVESHFSKRYVWTNISGGFFPSENNFVELRLAKLGAGPKILVFKKIPSTASRQKMFTLVVVSPIYAQKQKILFSLICLKPFLFSFVRFDGKGTKKNPYFSKLSHYEQIQSRIKEFWMKTPIQNKKFLPLSRASKQYCIQLLYFIYYIIIYYRYILQTKIQILKTLAISVK